MKLKKVVIIGAGFMGGSLARAIKNRGIANSVLGVARNEKRAGQIKKLRIFDDVTDDLAFALEGASLVILSTPVYSVIEHIKKISGLIYKDTPVTDLGSTKREILKYARIHLSGNFTGSHPLCGSEKRGAKNSVDSLFEGSQCIVIPIKRNKPFRTVRQFWRSLGSTTIVLDEAAHDKILAFTSGLPHLLSFSLTRSLPVKFSRFAAGSFKDLTRISVSESLLWSEIFLSNKTYLKQATGKFLMNLTTLLNIIDKKDKKKLTSFLKEINQKHKRLFNK